jgi:hypothetical protein
MFYTAGTIGRGPEKGKKGESDEQRFRKHTLSR